MTANNSKRDLSKIELEELVDELIERVDLTSEDARELKHRIMLSGGYQAKRHYERPATEDKKSRASTFFYDTDTDNEDDDDL